MQRAFVIRPFGTKTDSSGTEIDFERVHQELIGPALINAALGGGTTGEIVEPGNIREDMFALIIEADLVICDITVHNANVFYELGIRHALRKKRSVLMKGGPVKDGTPFDLLTDRYVRYDVANPAAALGALTETIRAALNSDRETDSPVFKMLPSLPEIDAAVIQAVPIDFREDVARARAAESAGWLRLLASEVLGLRFQWPALRLVAQAQWELKDYEGARKSYELIRSNDSEDIEANLALANIFERLYRLQKRTGFLEDSNQAIARVLESKKSTGAQIAEAEALRARNLKTLWRIDFEGEADLARRRETATSRALLRSYEAYRSAYLRDLNHYWPGLAALQQGTVAADLSSGEVWEDAFDNNDQAAAYRGELTRQLEALRPAVSQAIEAALMRPGLSEDERIWAKLSAADLMFLGAERAKRVVQAYKDAIPRNRRFAWDAAKGQLGLFAQLGIKAELANEIILAMDSLMAAPEPDKTELHLIVFAGHRADEPGRSTARFPASSEAKARDLIREKLATTLTAGARVHVLASAAPGSDILCHEICRDLGIDGTICLPMPKENFARLALVPSRIVLEFADASPGDMMVSDQAARSRS